MISLIKHKSNKSYLGLEVCIGVGAGKGNSVGWDGVTGPEFELPIPVGIQIVHKEC